MRVCPVVLCGGAVGVAVVGVAPAGGTLYVVDVVGVLKVALPSHHVLSAVMEVADANFLIGELSGADVSFVS